ncbi:unnamed protein product [Rotaria sp. Silwood1]|nr:unnamed protein product [Rotaria sp. Silwood1]
MKSNNRTYSYDKKDFKQKTIFIIFQNQHLVVNDSTKSITETINNPDNQIFCANVIHIISQKAYVLCNACSGLLPLFASAISASHEIELLENMEGLSPKDALKIKKRVMNLSGLFILANTGNFSKLE